MKLIIEYNQLSPEERYQRVMQKRAHHFDGIIGEVVSLVYKEYEKTLREANGLDFDDLLSFGVKMFAGCKPASSWCQHVLVDE